MATTLYFKNVNLVAGITSPAWTAAYSRMLELTIGTATTLAGSPTLFLNAIDLGGATVDKYASTASVQSCGFYSDVFSNSVAISGAISFVIYALEDNMALNAAPGFEVWRCNGNGSLIQQICTARGTVELGTAAVAVTIAGTPDGTTILSGERLGVRVKVTQIPTASPFGSGNFISYFSGIAGISNTRITFTETIAFGLVPRNGTGANTVTMTGSGIGYQGGPRVGTGENTVSTTNICTGALDLKTGTGSNTTNITSLGLGLRLAAPQAAKGYIFGGDGGGTFDAHISTLNLTTEIIVDLVATMNQGRYAASSLSSATKGYVCGGDWSGGMTAQTRVDAFPYATETMATTTANIVTNRLNGVGVSTSTVGYVLGGMTGASTYTPNCHGITFATEAFKSVTATLLVSRAPAGGFQSTTTGYACGGYTGTYSTEIDGLLFSNETAVNPTAVLAVARWRSGSVASSTRGYICAGHTGANNGSVDGLEFATETAIDPVATVGARQNPVGVQSATKGYLVGGSTSATYTDGIKFSDETSLSTLASMLSYGRGDGVGCSYQFVATGPSGAGISAITQTSFGTGIVFNVSADIFGTGANTTTQSSAGTGQLGGVSGVGASTVDNFTQVSTGIALPILGTGTATTAFTGSGNGTVTTTTLTNSLFFCGGYDYDASPTANDVQRLQQSNETMTQLGSLPAINRQSATLSNPGAYGYIVPGGYQEAGVWAFPYSTQTWLVLAATIGVDPVVGHVGLNARVAGYVYGGSSTSTSLKKFLFSSETFTASYTSLNDRQSVPIGISANSAGYHACGTIATVNSTSVTRLDYTSETQTTIAATLAARRIGIGGVSSSTKGYAAGGATASNGSTATNEIDGLVFSTEAYNNPAAGLTTAVWRVAGGASTTKGVYAGGENTAGTPLTALCGLTLSSEAVANLSAVLTRQMSDVMTFATTSNASYLPTGGGLTTLDNFVSAGTGTVVANPGALFGSNTVDDVTSAGIGVVPHHPGMGYFGGGTADVVIDCVRFSDGSIVQTLALLYAAKQGPACVSSTLNSYFCGGYNATELATISGFEFATETSFSLSAVLSQARMYFAGLQSATIGYCMGGTTGGFSPNYATIDGILFSSETSVSPAVSLTSARGFVATMQSDNNGYAASGRTSDGTTEIDGIRFSDQTAINPSAALALARYGAVGLSTGGAGKGYVCAGFQNGVGDTADIESFIFSSETVGNPATNLVSARRMAGAVSGFAAGYVGGGSTGASITEVDGLRFSDESSLNPSSGLGTARYAIAGGYWRSEAYKGTGANTLATFTQSGLGSTQVTRFGTSSNTLDSIVSVATGNHISYGSGANTVTPSSTSTGVVPVRGTGANTVAPNSTSTGVAPVSGTGSNTTTFTSVGSGSVDGGMSPALGNGANTTSLTITATGNVKVVGTGASSVPDTTTTCSATAPISGTGANTVTLSSSATGTAVTDPGRGYFVSGSAASNSVDRINFADDTVSATAAILDSRYYDAAVSSTVCGYFAGGVIDSATTATMTGYTFATTTGIAVSAILQQSRQLLAGVMSDTKGYFLGGSNYAASVVYGEIDGILFSNNTATNPTAALTTPRYGMSSVMSTTRGYVVGGADPSFYYGYADGIVFATDTTFLQFSGSSGKLGAAGLNSAERGYSCGGTFGGASNVIDGFFFATEAYTALTTTLPVARYYASGVSSFSNGYIGGGYTGTPSDEIDGLKFSNETSINPSGALSTARFGLTGAYYRYASSSIVGANTTEDIYNLAEGDIDVGIDLSGTGANTLAEATSTGSGIVRTISYGSGVGVTTQSSTCVGTLRVSGTGSNTAFASSAGVSGLKVSGVGANVVAVSSTGVSATTASATGSALLALFSSTCVGKVLVGGSGAVIVGVVGSGAGANTARGVASNTLAAVASVSSGAVGVGVIGNSIVSASSVASGSVKTTGVTTVSIAEFVTQYLGEVKVRGVGAATVTMSTYGISTETPTAALRKGISVLVTMDDVICR